MFDGIAHVTVLPAIWLLPKGTAHMLAVMYGSLSMDTCHVYEYGEVPVEGSVLVMVSAWSTSKKGEDIEGVDAEVNSLYTVIVAEAGEVADSGTVAPSVTFSSKLYVSPTVNVFAGIEHAIEFPDIWPVPLFAEQSVDSEYAPLFTETSQL